MFILLGTSGCHLCEQASAMMSAVHQEMAFSLTEIDIAEQVQWQADYAIKIPVVHHLPSGRDLCWPFTQPDLINFINELNHDCTVSY